MTEKHQQTVKLTNVSNGVDNSVSQVWEWDEKAQRFIFSAGLSGKSAIKARQYADMAHSD